MKPLPPPRNVFDQQDIAEIKAMLAEGYTKRDVAQKYRTNRRNILRIKYGKRVKMSRF